MIIFNVAQERNDGGFGDRIVGLIACKTLADKKEREFKVLWEKEDISQFFDLNIYYMQRLDRMAYIHYMREFDTLQQTLQKINWDDNLLIRTNQEFSQYLFSDSDEYHNCIFNNYNQLYKNILKPKPLLLDNVNSLLNTKSPIIGIQIRCGDVFLSNRWLNDDYQPVKDMKEITMFLTKIKKQNNIINGKYFITSDNPEAIVIAKSIFGEENIIFYDKPIIHIDRQMIDDETGEKKIEGLLKLFTDAYILSQKSSILYISDYSNFGRIACLSCNHNRIFNLNCEKLNKKMLLTKHTNIHLEK